MRGLMAVVVMAAACGGDGEGDSAADAAAVPEADARTGSAWLEHPDVPSVVQENAVAVVDGKVYVVGGLKDPLPSTTVTDEVWVYDVATEQWSQGPSLPAPLHHVNLAAAGGSLYVVGALEGFGFDALGVTLSYTPGDTAWQTRTSMPLARARGASGVAAIGDVIYVIGGSRDASTAEVDAYDVVADEWTALPDAPAALNHLVAAAVDGKVYAIGGRTTGIADVRATVYELDPAGPTWTEKAPMPTARGGCAAGVVDGAILVVGGEGAPNAAGVFVETEGYDPATDTWTSHEPMVTPRHGMGAAGVDGRLYVPGGAVRQGLGLDPAAPSHESFDPSLGD